MGMKVLVVDDDPEMIEVVSLAIGMRWPDAEIVSAQDGGAGIQMVETEAPDVVILDIGLPDIDGFNVCLEVRRFSDVPIIMLTVRDTESDIVKGLQVGADDYVTKPFRPIEFMARVQSVMRRAEVVPFNGEEKVFQHEDLVVDFARREVFRGGQPVKLTHTEYQILYHLTKNAGRVLLHKTLLGQVWGREYLDETNYLKVHIQHLRQKLGDDPAHPRYILTERSVGYKFAKT
jgi:two-component system KDP operon response regulator KdpE